MVVEEVNDNEISNEAFMLIRDGGSKNLTKNGMMVNSMLENSLNSCGNEGSMMLMEGVDRHKLQHTGSV